MFRREKKTIKSTYLLSCDSRGGWLTKVKKERRDGQSRMKEGIKKEEEKN